MESNPSNPLIVQSDRTLLLDVHAPLAEEARSALLPFAELEKSPEHLHTYRISSLSLWNAASAGLGPEEVLEVLEKYSRYPVPLRVMDEFSGVMSRYGKIRLISPGLVRPEAEGPETGPEHQEAAAPLGSGKGSGDLFLTSDDEAILAELGAAKPLEKLIRKTQGGFLVRLIDRGSVKRELIKLGWPVKDEAPLVKGEPLEISLRSVSASGKPFAPRDYQHEAAAAVLGSGAPGSGYGVVVLPCGSGKTMVGMLVMSLLKTNTLILTTNVAAVHQWINELLDKTGLPRETIAEYSGDSKSVAPVTIATYQILTWRPDKDADFPHFPLFRLRQWGLIIYDEVHLLPAPVFRITAELQAVRRLGLTATLVREDHAEDAVFSLVGPKRYDVPWKDLESKGWIASALCTEIRLDMPEDHKIPYAVAPPREKYRMASENPYKAAIVRELIANHPEDHILVIGQYLSQLEITAALLKAPLITGKTPNGEREHIYQAFRNGELRIIVVSKVANFAIDLPDASMAIQISGSFGSRQEEAQRLGRIIRPKKRNSYFYTLVSRYTVEEDFASNRRKFLAEQGYTYSIQYWSLEEILSSENAQKEVLP
ncbi:MAG: DEAD/DEAH box helicase [Spirochaetaceae bacterium]|jgi:DNA excision repair protein ERCC-3|nr:DEAD/DEAH box helicase [Spirochaetaceae bacterium]